MKSITVIIAVGNRLLSEGLTELLNKQNNINTIHQVDNKMDLLNKIENNLPTIVILDFRFSNINVWELGEMVQLNYSEIYTLFINVYNSKFSVNKLLKSGAHGILFNNASIEKLNHAISEITVHGFFYDTRVIKYLKERVSNGYSFEIFLDHKELHILKYVCEERTSQEIAEKLNLNKKTVDRHRKEIMEKLGVRNTAGLVKIAIVNQLIPLE